MPHTAVFFDRAGPLIQEVEYCADPALVRAYPGILAALEQLKQAGYLALDAASLLNSNTTRSSANSCAAPQARIGNGSGSAADFNIDLTQSYFIGRSGD